LGIGDEAGTGDGLATVVCEDVATGDGVAASVVTLDAGDALGDAVGVAAVDGLAVGSGMT
jgi:hypothetical protein